MGIINWFKPTPTNEHRFCQENLSPFLDRQMDSRGRSRVEKHLQECAECRAELESLRQTVALLRTAPMHKPPRSFFIPLSEGARQKTAQRYRLVYGYLQAATAVAMVLMVLVVSGDALLRFGGMAARQATPAVEVMSGRGGGDEPSGESRIAAAPIAPQATPAALTEPQDTVAMAAEDTSPPDVEGQTAKANALPSQTFARPAAAPPLPTPTAKAAQAESATESTPPPVAFGAPTAEPAPTALPPGAIASPTAEPAPTALPPVAIALPTSEPAPPPMRGTDQAEPVSAPPRGMWALLETARPLLPWLELALSGLIVALLAAILLVRRRGHAA